MSDPFKRLTCAYKQLEPDDREMITRQAERLAWGQAHYKRCLSSRTDLNGVAEAIDEWLDLENYMGAELLRLQRLIVKFGGAPTK